MCDGASERRSEDRGLCDLLGIQNRAQAVRQLFDGRYARVGWIDYAVSVTNGQGEVEG